eukprot:4246745-Prorocentrum_lima.AAC.1
MGHSTHHRQRAHHHSRSSCGADCGRPNNLASALSALSERNQQLLLEAQALRQRRDHYAKRTYELEQALAQAGIRP